jgi:hypothetical protein
VPAKPRPDWVQTGWDMWYYINNNIVRYSSTSTAWKDLPSTGVQLQVRHYTNGKKNWLESISGSDFYIESEAVKEYLPINSPIFKLGTSSNECIHDAIDQQTDSASFKNDPSMTKYISDSKSLIGWTVWRANDDNVLERYSSSDESNNTWEAVPNTGIILLSRKFQEGNEIWDERVVGQEIYVLRRSDEADILRTYPFIKGGSMAPIEILDTISAQYADEYRSRVI